MMKKPFSHEDSGVELGKKTLSSVNAFPELSTKRPPKQKDLYKGGGCTSEKIFSKDPYLVQQAPSNVLHSKDLERNDTVC
jgi:hypothetical protein